MPEPPTPSNFAKKLATIAHGQFDQLHLFHETDPPLSGQIKKFWTTLGFNFPGVETAWSAVFISFCVKTAGANANEFDFSTLHSVFVQKAIQNAVNQTGVFQGVKISEKAVNIGDLIQNNRNGNNFDFDFAKANSHYESHSAIIISRGEDALGKFAMTIGGNEGNSIGMKRVKLNPDGTVKQRNLSSYICLVKNLK